MTCTLLYHCSHCGSAVTASFARIFGDRDDSVDHCPHCREPEAAAKDGPGSDASVAGD